MTLEKIIVHQDGGCPANPGHGSWAWVIDFVGLDRKVTGSGFVKDTTNNQMEYRALCEAAGFLLRVDDLGPEIEFRSDSMLVVQQLNGVWQQKEPSLRDIYNLALGRIAKLRLRVPKLSIGWIKRDFNMEADALCNEVLDAHGVVGVAKPRRVAFLR
jgi:ribonuclease HI